jgi:hypothetical protein
MKILVTRRIRTLSIFHPDEIQTEWENKILHCDHCGCQFLLETQDKPKILAKSQEVDGGVVGVDEFVVYFVFCPEDCGSHVEIKKDDWVLRRPGS